MIKNELLERIMKTYELREGMKITFDLIKQVSYIEEIEIKDLACMLQISGKTMYKLKKEMQKYTKLKFNKYKGVRNKKIFKKGKITYQEFNNLKNKMNLKDYTMARMLGISIYSYRRMKKGEIQEVRIKDIKTKHIVDLIKIDLIYLGKNGYHTIDELKKICNQRKVTLDQFVEYYNDNPKHQKFNKMIVERSLEGFWISKETKISDEFMKEYDKEIMTRLGRVAKKVATIIGCKRYNEDLVQEAVIELCEKCGNIVRNFYFDIKVLFNILMSKAKYIMLNVYRKKYKENNMSYDSFEDSYIDHMNILRDDRYDPQLLLD